MAHGLALVSSATDETTTTTYRSDWSESAVAHGTWFARLMPPGPRRNQTRQNDEHVPEESE